MAETFSVELSMREAQEAQARAETALKQARPRSAFVEEPSDARARLPTIRGFLFWSISGVTRPPADDRRVRARSERRITCHDQWCRRGRQARAAANREHWSKPSAPRPPDDKSTPRATTISDTGAMTNRTPAAQACRSHTLDGRVTLFMPPVRDLPRLESYRRCRRHVRLSQRGAQPLGEIVRCEAADLQEDFEAGCELRQRALDRRQRAERACDRRRHG